MGAQVNARVTPANIKHDLRQALVRFIKVDFLQAGATTGFLNVDRCTKEFFHANLLGRNLVGTVTSADGQHNHQTTVNPGHGTTSAAALQVNWTELAARHRAGTDLTTLVVELARRGVYVEYNQLRHILRCESKLATQDEMKMLGATKDEVAVFNSGTSKDKQMKMWLRHKYSPVVVVAERRYARQGRTPAYLQRYIKIPANPMNPMLNPMLPQGQHEVDAGGADVADDDDGAVVLLDITNMDRSFTVGPHAG